ncbi:uncharacterized protein VICG_00163 [Vittaforma corneae ATCC 50505]|uniref:Uncharacterized protein n=1 Tax=Vittaforma corneae (strain ATCC 50505) TaxID=993615 RepID=L2GPM9_VITCO|nr:uncharacterized protein VICG_00163 [Vittaforma corneae ATCC 50505]ELA42848.1 hypothetical protein VICG_00163 [Vittaforma corneae ATCC 50505]
MPKIIAVMSGKGGVGKSSVSIAIAAIVSEKYSTVLLDFDICGPSTTTALNATGSLIKVENGFKPVSCSSTLDVLSFGSILNPSDAVIWRGPKKLMFLNLFFNSIQSYDYVIIDTPPGISEEHDFLADKGVSVIIVTTPQNISLNDTQRCIEFCLSRNISILGVIENMSSFRCECCGEIVHPFGSKGGKQLSDEYGLKFLCELPIEARFSGLIDAGRFKEGYKTLETCEIIRKILVGELCLLK